MKTNKILLTALLTAVPLFGFTQEWDDIYADPTQNEPVKVQKEQKEQKAQKEQKEQQKKEVVIIKGDASNIELMINGRDVDEYNRRNKKDKLQEEKATPIMQKITRTMSIPIVLYDFMILNRASKLRVPMK